MSSAAHGDGRERDLSPLLNSEPDESPVRRKMSATGAAMEVGVWPPDMDMVEPTINVLAFFDRPVPPAALADAIEQHLWPATRFRCNMEDGYWVARHTHMDRSYHFQQRSVSSEFEIDQWVQKVMLKALDKNFPLWQITLLNAPAGVRSAMFMRVHHAIGDGLSLLFAFTPLLCCDGGDPLSKVPLPMSLLPPDRQRGRRQRSSANAGCVGCGVCAAVRGALTPALARHDTELRINAPLSLRTPYLIFNHRRALTRFPSVDMALIGEIKTKQDCTVNDVIMAALTGALRRYGAEVCGDEKLRSSDETIEFKSMVMLALPRHVDESDLLAESCANRMLFTTCPLPIDEPSPGRRLQRTIEAFNNLKDPNFIAGLAGFSDFVKGIAPSSFLQKTMSEVFSKHSLLVTNVPSTSVPIRLPDENGAVLDEVQMVFINIIPQVSIITYDGRVHANIVADPGVIPQPERLGEMWAEEFNILAELDTSICASPTERSSASSLRHRS